LIRRFFPWELRKDGADGAPLSLPEEQRLHFLACIDDDFSRNNPLILTSMPSAALRNPFAEPICGEVVLVNGHRSLVQGAFDIGTDTTRCYAVYSMNVRESFVARSDHLLRHHEVGSKVWSFLMRDTAVVESYDAFKEEVGIRWERQGLKQTQAVVHPSTLRSPLVGMPRDGSSAFPRLFDNFLRQLRFRETLTHLFFQRPVVVVGPRVMDVKAHHMTVKRIQRVGAMTARDFPFDSGIKLELYNPVQQKDYYVDYDEVRDAE
jgi:hypothetical protein